MKGWREHAAYVLQKHGAIAAKMKFLPGAGTTDFAAFYTTAGWLRSKPQ